MKYVLLRLAIYQKLMVKALGLAVVELGGGRIVENDKINPAVGISGIARLGTYLEKDQPIAVIHANPLRGLF